MRSWPRRDRQEQGIPTPWLILGCGLALTVAATLSVAVSTAGRDEVRFDNAVQSAADRIRSRLDIYISTLRGGAALFAAAAVDAGAFRRYADRLELQRWYPGIQGFGWTERIAAALDGEEDERHAIIFLEPLDERNREAIGFDMYSEPSRRDAMRRARDRGEPAMSGRVRLVQEIFGPAQPGFLIYVPVYATDSVPVDAEARRRALRGFVYAPFRATDLFMGIFGTEEQPRVYFSVHDGTAVDTTTLLFASERPAAHTPRHTDTVTVEIAGRQWTVVFESRPEFEAASMRRFVPMVFLTGLLVSLLLFGLARGQARARAAAESASMAKSAFLASMSHELRTPLNAIGGYVDLMRLRVPGPLNAQQQVYLDRVQRAQKHLLGLINDVLNFTRLEAGRVQFALRRLSPAGTVAEAAAMIALQAEQQGIEFTIAGGPDEELVGDGEKLRQVLLNLYSNAVKFTPAGGRITTHWNRAGDHVEIHVTDTGVGIAADRLEEIFEPFLQVDADLARQQQGTGLGLSISRELARGMGGDLRVSSRHGHGSTFTVSLPAARGP